MVPTLKAKSTLSLSATHTRRAHDHTAQPKSYHRELFEVGFSGLPPLLVNEDLKRGGNPREKLPAATKTARSSTTELVVRSNMSSMRRGTLLVLLVPCSPALRYFK